MSYRELEALIGQAADISVLVDGIEDWGAATRCEPMTLWDLVMHMSVNFTPPPFGSDERVTASAADWFRYDANAVSTVVGNRVKEVREVFVGADPSVKWKEFAADIVAFASGSYPDSPVRHWDGRFMRLRDYVAARGVVELGVHALDLAEALGRPQRLCPLAEETVVGILDALLDGPRPDFEDATTYILVATGRRPAPEPSADRFPLFA